MSKELLLSDMDVVRLSDSLSQKPIDLIVSGSIAAVESVRIARSLRRLGATVTPWLTEGGAEFVTPLSLSWAAHQQTRTQFSGVYSHLATGSCCIVAPASASFITRLAQGATSTAPLALAQSYLGSGKPVVLLPTMHASLWENQTLQDSIKLLKDNFPEQIVFLEPIQEEGKLKLPSPESVADHLSHLLNRANACKVKAVLITLGGTREAIDPVRFITNISSGTTGTIIAEELYRQGFRTNILAANCHTLPKVFSSLTRTYSHASMLQEIQSSQNDAAICAAAVADYTPSDYVDTKIPSMKNSLEIKLKPTAKLIRHIRTTTAAKIAFKLETSQNVQQSESKLISYLEEYGLSAIVFNLLKDVSATKHAGHFATKTSEGLAKQSFNSKQQLATFICQHLKSY